MTLKPFGSVSVSDYDSFHFPQGQRQGKEQAATTTTTTTMTMTMTMTMTTNSSQQKLAKTPPDQPIDFQISILPSPNIANNSSGSSTHTSIIITKQQKRGRIFHCGYRYFMVEHMFPEYEHIINPKRGDTFNHDNDNNNNNNNNNDNDILVVGMWGPACNNGKGDELTSFTGKILYINGESTGDVVSKTWSEKHLLHHNKTIDVTVTDQVYQIGPYPRRGDGNDNDNDNGNDDNKTLALNKYYNSHSLQVYFTALNFMESIYFPNKEVNNNRPRSSKEEGKPSSSSSSSPHDEEKIPNNSTSLLFDPWKLLVEGIAVDDDALDRRNQARIPAVVYVSRNCVPYRRKAAMLLAREFQALAEARAEAGTATTEVYEESSFASSRRHYQKKKKSSFVHYGGSCTVPGGIPVPSTVMTNTNGAVWRNGNREQFHSNYETIYTRYKYCLVMENTNTKGYATEKLLHALLGGCLPIYYGTKEVYDLFREDAFVFLDIENPEPALAELRRLENDHDEYLRRTSRKRPLLKKTTTSHGDNDTSITVDKYFSLFPNIGTGRLCREIHEMMGLPLPASLSLP